MGGIRSLSSWLRRDVGFLGLSLHHRALFQFNSGEGDAGMHSTRVEVMSETRTLSLREALEDAVEVASNYYALFHDEAWKERLDKWEDALRAQEPPKFSEYERIAHEMCRKAGCKCETPLLGWSDHKTPRCRLCCVEVRAQEPPQAQEITSEYAACKRCRKPVQWDEETCYYICARCERKDSSALLLRVGDTPVSAERST